MSETLELKFLKLYEDSVIPAFATTHSACMDLKAYIYNRDIDRWNSNNTLSVIQCRAGCFYIERDCRALIPTGLKAIIPEGYCIEVFSRSGFSLKNGIMLVNSVGVIDSDYTNEIFIPVINVSNEGVVIAHGERIAQMRMKKLVDYSVTEISQTDYDSQAIEKLKFRRGGFGSTGTK